MKIILTHHNADFDALAAMYGAYLLHRDAVPVLPLRLNRNVAGFLTVYGRTLPFVDWKLFRTQYNAADVTQVIITDTDSAKFPTGIPAATPVHIIDHHDLKRDLQPHETRHYEALGAITTYFVEQLRAKQRKLSSVAATLLALGIYADTGMLTYGATTSRDAYALAWLLQQGANLDDIRRALANPLDETQQRLLDDLLDDIETVPVQGYSILIATAERDVHVSGLNSVTQVLRNLLDGTALFVLLQTPDTVQLVARSVHDDVNVGEVARFFGGGGHPRAAAATINDATLAQVSTQIIEKLRHIVRPAMQVHDLMSADPYTVQAKDKVMDVLPRLRRIGHEGYPVLDGTQLVGLLNLRDADRSAEHKLKTAVVEHIMQSGNVHVRAHDAVDTLERRMANSRWGQIPVLNDTNDLIGIVTRTDLIRYRASQQNTTDADMYEATAQITPQTVESILGADSLALIDMLRERADAESQVLYMVGGVVRDLLLQRANLDIDFVLEGNAIAFAKALKAQYGGHLHTYPPFGTAKWTLDANVAKQLQLDFANIPDHLDFASARHEFYEHPTALPTVYRGNVKLDAARRDFTINALAVQLGPPQHAWQIRDYFGGLADLQNRIIRVLHSLSFVDDPTRILRAVRFSERLKFVIDPRSTELITGALPMLERITGERLRHEFELIFKEPAIKRILLKVLALDVPQAIHPDFVYLPETVELLPPLQTKFSGDELIDMCWHLLLIAPTDALFDRLLFGKTLREAIQQSWQLRDTPGILADKHTPPSKIVEYLADKQESALCAAHYFQEITAPDGAEIMHIRNYLETYRHVKPGINGNTLREMGLPPGPRYKKLLRKLRDARLDGEIKNDFEETNYLDKLLHEGYGL